MSLSFHVLFWILFVIFFVLIIIDGVADDSSCSIMGTFPHFIGILVPLFG